MKTHTKTLICTLGWSLVSLGLTAANEKTSIPEYQLPEYQAEDISTLPEPTHNPVPTISTRYVGMDLRLKLTVNEKGRPEMVRLEKPLSSYSDIHQMTFASQMRDLVANWKFEPAVDANGEAVAIDVILPVQVVEKGESLTAVVTLILDDGKSDRS